MFVITRKYSNMRCSSLVRHHYDVGCLFPRNFFVYRPTIAHSLYDVGDVRLKKGICPLNAK